jgi:hypothetical protein
MPLIKDLPSRAQKLNYLFPYLSILLPLGHIIIYLQLLPLVTHLGVTRVVKKTITVLFYETFELFLQL